METTTESLHGFGVQIHPDNITQSWPHSTVSSTVPTSHILLYIFIPLGCLFVIALLALVVLCVIKKNRLDKLRHNLMPVYTYEPGEEEQDWESELLEDQMQQLPFTSNRSPIVQNRPQLQFDNERV